MYSRLCFAAFFLLYHAVSQQQPNALSQQQLNTQGLHTQKHRRLQNNFPDLPKTAVASPDAQSHAANQGKTGDASLTRPQKVVRIAFYLWLGLLNLLATSTLWARAADAFDSNAASRLFGFLGAGATIGAFPVCFCCELNAHDSLQTLSSTLWARVADAFANNAAFRLFGFPGAGAAIGALPFHICCDDDWTVIICILLHQCQVCRSMFSSCAML